MKQRTVLAVFLMVASVCVSQVKAEPKANFEIGTIESDHILLHRTLVTATAIPGQIQTQDVNYNNIEVVVTAIRANEVGPTQNSVVQLVSAGVGWTGADLRFRSDVGKGYFYQLEVWGKIRR